MTFRVGQEVVCIDDDEDSEYPLPGYRQVGGLDGLTKGKIYTIARFGPEPEAHNIITVVLIEIVRPTIATGIHFDGFHPARFRPIVKPDISVFTSMLQPTPKKAKKNEPA